jgi:hypothetical protein
MSWRAAQAVARVVHSIEAPCELSRLNPQSRAADMISAPPRRPEFLALPGGRPVRIATARQGARPGTRLKLVCQAGHMALPPLDMGGMQIFRCHAPKFLIFRREFSTLLVA